MKLRKAANFAQCNITGDTSVAGLDLVSCRGFSTCSRTLPTHCPTSLRLDSDWMVASNIDGIDCCYQSGTPPAFHVLAAGEPCSQQFGDIAPEVQLVVASSRWWDVGGRTVDDPCVHHGDIDEEPEDVPPPLLRRPPNLVVGAELIGEIDTAHVCIVMPNRRRLQLGWVSNGNHLSVAVGGQDRHLAFVLPDGQHYVPLLLKLHLATLLQLQLLRPSW